MGYIYNKTTLSLIPLALLLLGCGEADEDAGLSPIAGSYEPAEEASYTLDLIVDPPPTSSLPTFNLPRTRAQRSFVVELPAAIPYNIRVINLENAQNVDAEVLFRSTTSRSGSTILASPSIRAGETETSVRLTPGNYDILVSPLDERFPPFSDNFTVDPLVSPSDEREKDLVIPDNHREIRGVVRDRISLTSLVQGVTITARGDTSGLISTKSVSNEKGEYTLLLPEANDTLYELTAILPDTQQPAWTYRQQVRVNPSGEEDRVKDIDVDIPSDAIRGLLTLDVIGDGLLGPESIPNARCVLRLNEPTTDNNSFGRTYELNGFTNQQGQLVVNDSTSLPILRGEYTVSVFPNPDARFATYIEGTLNLPEIGGNIEVNEQIILEPRVAVLGMVTNAVGEPSSFSRVRFRSNTTPNSTFFELNTEEDGTFVTYLDPDEYVVTAQASTGPGFVANIINVESIRNEVTLASETLQFPPMNIVEGVIFQSNGDSLAGAEIFERIQVGNTVVIRNEVTTDENGTFLLAIPAP